MKRRIEPFWWSLFGAGGAISALTLPVLLIVFGLAIPLGLISPSYELLEGVVDIWWVRLIFTAIISLSMFHWAHRFRFTLYEGLQLHQFNKTIAVFCYGTATVTSLVSGFLLLI